MKITCLGTNGWFCSETGDTVCTLIETDDYYIFLDAGNGMRRAEKLVKPDKPVYILLSHFHLDHIFGLHGMCGLMPKDLTILGQPGTKDILKTFINHPFTASPPELSFPVRIKELKEGVNNVPFPVTCKPLVHADPVFGFRLELEGKIITYCTDTGVCDNFRELARDADLLISECYFRSGQKCEWFHMDSDVKWPHMNPEKAAGIARDAGAKRLLLTHFGPEIYRTLKQRKEAEKAAKKVFPNTAAATDGLQVNL